MEKEKKIKFVLVNVWQFPAQTPHFGLISLAAYVRQELPETEVKIIEGLNPLDEIKKFLPDIVCFTSDTLVYTKTLSLARKLKKHLAVPFLLGGVQVTAMPTSIDPVFNLGVLGEGEVTLVELIKLFEKERSFLSVSLKKVDGLIFWNKSRLIVTNKRELIRDIDSLPYPARDLVPMKEYYLKNQINLFGVKKMATLMTSRGCPYHCVFCGSPVQWGRVRFHSAEYVVEEIKMLKREYDIDGIMFWDDLFTAPVARIEKMVELIKQSRLEKQITFFGYARANLIDEKMCRLLKSINVKRLIFGLESGSEKILGYLKQNSVTVKDNRRAVELCRRYGITTSSGYIVGTPGETLSDLNDTYQFMKKYPLDNTQIYILTPYPGTKIWAEAEKEGLVNAQMNFSKLFVQLPALKWKDFLKRDKPEIIKNRIFLNTPYKNNQEYLRLIFKMQKLAMLQNWKFYLKTISKDVGLVIRIIIKKLKI